MARQITDQARQENIFAYEETAQNPSSWFDLSHDVKTTFRFGMLTPFLCRETLPGDLWRMNFEVMTRFEPLYFPLMHRVNMKLWVFHVKNRILWREVSGNDRDWETMGSRGAQSVS